LDASFDYGSKAGMGQMQKITVEVLKDDLERAQALTGEGITETVRAGLKQLRSMWAQKRALELRGKVKFSMTLEEMRYDRE
jgi:hypothetical protein